MVTALGWKTVVYTHLEEYEEFVKNVIHDAPPAQWQEIGRLLQ